MAFFGWLVLLGEAGDQSAYSLSSQRVVISRDPTADITLGDPAVSRQHAVLRCSAEAVSIQDLHSVEQNHGALHVDRDVQMRLHMELLRTH